MNHPSQVAVHTRGVRLWVLATALSTVLCGLLASFTSSASEAETLFSAQCASCHGSEAKGTLLAPALAGQQLDYLARQLKHFKSGLRGSHAKDVLGAQMVAVSSGLDDAAVVAVSTYLSQLPQARVNSALTGSKAVAAATNQRRGYTYYHSTCGGCHGGKAEGNPLLNAPRLAGLSPDYLQRQILHFATGIRGTDKQDRYGRQMAMMSKSLDKETLADVIAFIAAQP